MKAFIALFALVAAVAAEADPYFYGYGGYPYAYGAGALTYGAYGAYAPVTYVAAPETGCTNNFGLPVPCAFKSVEKRSADADAEADPQYFYNGAYAGYGYGYGYPYAYGAYGYYPYAYSGCRNNAGVAVPCAHGHAIAKRDAEADPAYYVSPFLARYGFPSTYYGNGLVHTSHFGVCVNYKGEKVPC